MMIQGSRRNNTYQSDAERDTAKIRFCPSASDRLKSHDFHENYGAMIPILSPQIRHWYLCGYLWTLRLIRLDGFHFVQDSKIKRYGKVEILFSVLLVKLMRNLFAQFKCTYSFVMNSLKFNLFFYEIIFTQLPIYLCCL